MQREGWSAGADESSTLLPSLSLALPFLLCPSLDVHLFMARFFLSLFSPFSSISLLAVFSPSFLPLLLLFSRVSLFPFSRRFNMAVSVCCAVCSCFLLPSREDHAAVSGPPSPQASSQDFSSADAELSRPPSVDLSVVVPAFNESLRLPFALAELISFLEARRASSRLLSASPPASSSPSSPSPSSSPPSSSSLAGAPDNASLFTYEIIVVDDGSTDATSALVPLLGAAIFSPSSSPSAARCSRAAAAAAEAASLAFSRVYASSSAANETPRKDLHLSSLAPLGRPSSAVSACSLSSSLEESPPISVAAAEATRAATRVHLAEAAGHQRHARLSRSGRDASRRGRDSEARTATSLCRRVLASDGEAGTRTEEEAEDEVPASSPLSSLRVLRLKENRGKGFSVKLGAMHARGRMLLMADADGATTVDNLVSLERAVLIEGERTRRERSARERTQRERAEGGQRTARDSEACDSASPSPLHAEGDWAEEPRGKVVELSSFSETNDREGKADSIVSGTVELEHSRSAGESGCEKNREALDRTEEAREAVLPASTPPLAFPWRRVYRRETQNEQAETEAFVAFGSRRQLEQAAIASRSWLRNFLMHAFHWCVRAVVGDSRVKDTQCGFKLFTRSAARQLFPRLHLCRWAFDVELLLLARLRHVPVAEVPVEWQEKEGSKLNVLGASFQMARDILVLKCMYTAGLWG
ncbi:dolichyl-phosphate beta-glucosyltransferase [Toxoplasma gondii GAB2-2007-GAL-DOM2]|uniref:Dolichyl-phosphate beta-glucosyltransferase n=3 Tax=Toxoplasma gondii TaxID=5811 RepID=A0A086K9H7_TOXGO|nr:dolichyl-phosphate beta-glucosyltransferase [Toxoplasma gondii GAB2-2007-GAL-DOM2]KFG41045.1 dolichyl-phosphate beta-glucosyltransferase [Toxoplasma gondii FOU]PUA84337.1 dolichyl-phosphate beta-glucosyltransferase [Toxoplasma gondii TgCATBr9]